MDVPAILNAHRSTEPRFSHQHQPGAHGKTLEEFQLVPAQTNQTLGTETLETSPIRNDQRQQDIADNRGVEALGRAEGHPNSYPSAGGFRFESRDRPACETARQSPASRGNGAGRRRRDRRQRRQPQRSDHERSAAVQQTPLPLRPAQSHVD